MYRLTLKSNKSIKPSLLSSLAVFTGQNVSSFFPKFLSLLSLSSDQTQICSIFTTTNLFDLSNSKCVKCRTENNARSVSDLLGECNHITYLITVDCIQHLHLSITLTGTVELMWTMKRKTFE